MRVLSSNEYRKLMLGTAPLPVSYRQISDLYWPPVAPTPPRPANPIWPSESGVDRRAHFYYLLHLTATSARKIVLCSLLAAILGYLLWNRSVPEVNNYFFQALAILSLVLAAIASKRYFRWWKVGPKNLLSRDPRPPVLVLRTFKQSDLPADDLNTYGEPLEIFLQNYGPLVSLRNDSEKLPPVGPFSVETTHNEWQKEVVSYLEQSVLIIVFMGLSQGLLWELNEIATRGFLYRTALVVPAGFSLYDLKLLQAMLTDNSELEGTTRKVSLAKGLQKLLPMAAPIIERPEFQILWQDEFNEALLVRWTLSGEPIVIKESNREWQALKEALFFNIHLSGNRSVGSRQ